MIKNYLDNQPGGCTTMDVANALGVSPATARRTLRDLHKQGAVRKTTGGHPVIRWTSVKEADVADPSRNGKGDPRYTVHMNVKLTPEQAAVIRASGQPESTWIREAVERALDGE
jgi:DNA-binding transcriptional regulator LsrR (DeoR family)